MIDERHTADEVPRLASGTSAAHLLRMILILLAAGLACLPLIGLAARVAPPDIREPMTGAVLAAVMVLGSLEILSSVRLARAIEREREAGYTTLYGRYFELWQLDPKTGDVLRRPGEREVRRRPRDGPLD